MVMEFTFALEFTFSSQLRYWLGESPVSLLNMVLKLVQNVVRQFGPYPAQAEEI